MRQSELLKSIAGLTQHQKRKLETYIVDALKLNDEDEACKPVCCPYYRKKSRMIKKGFSHGKRDINAKNVSIFSLIILIRLQCIQK